MIPIVPMWLKALIIAAALGAAVYFVDANGYGRAKGKYELQIARSDKLRADEARIADAEHEQNLEEQASNVLRLSEQLITANATIDAQTARLNERATNVSTFYRPQPQAALLPVPGWIVTHGWVCDYNRAIGYSVPGAGAAVGGIESPSCAADAFGPSAVIGSGILVHHEQYAAYCRKLEKQVNALLDQYEFIEKGGSK